MRRARTAMERPRGDDVRELQRDERQVRAAAVKVFEEFFQATEAQ